MDAPPPAPAPRARCERAIAKAEHERQRSQALAGRARSAPRADRLPGGAARVPQRQALEDGRLLRAKLMATRAVLGPRAPGALRPHARPAGGGARRRAPIHGADAAQPPTDGRDAEIELLLCATHAVGGDPEAARLARAHVTEAERADPANTVALAVCAAALGETAAALAALESFVLRPLVPPQRPRPARHLLWRTTGTTCAATPASRACSAEPARRSAVDLGARRLLVNPAGQPASGL